MNKVYIGTSGFTLQNFYPETITSEMRLAFYASKFSTVEINSCFYHLPTLKTLNKWQDAVSEDFVFSFKVWKEVTHSEEGLFNENKLALWLERFTQFKTNKHLMLFQFPKSTKYSISSLKKLVKLLPSGFKYAFEFRHTDWFNQDIYSLVNEKNMSVVLSHGPVKADTTYIWPFEDVKSNPFVYIRFHGSKKLYFSSYSSEEIETYSQFIQEKTTDSKDVYCYFNNDALGAAASNADELQQLVRK